MASGGGRPAMAGGNPQNSPQRLSSLLGQYSFHPLASQSSFLHPAVQAAMQARQFPMQAQQAAMQGPMQNQMQAQQAAMQAMGTGALQPGGPPGTGNMGQNTGGANGNMFGGGATGIGMGQSMPLQAQLAAMQAQQGGMQGPMQAMGGLHPMQQAYMHAMTSQPLGFPGAHLFGPSPFGR